MERKKQLVSLESLVDEEPLSLIARLREAIPLIEASLQAGHSLRSIHRRLNEAGFSICYNTLATYRRRLKHDKIAISPKKPPKVNSSPEGTQQSGAPTPIPDGFDPAANFREQIKKRPIWEYPSGPPDESKLF